MYHGPAHGGRTTMSSLHHVEHASRQSAPDMGNPYATYASVKLVSQAGQTLAVVKRALAHETARRGSRSVQGGVPNEHAQAPCAVAV